MRLIRIAAQSDDLALANVELASVLVVAEDDRLALRRSVPGVRDGLERRIGAGGNLA